MASQSIDHQENDLACKYSYKKCPNRRTTKRNGTLHSLCEYHRIKANTLQQVYAKKKKEAASMLTTPTTMTPATTTMTMGSMTRLMMMDGISSIDSDCSESWLDEIDFTTPPRVVTEEDWRTIRELL
ncbi:Aste57867_9645 [Aphanomyces stellatus]|uniref:Aste57867_9645 protein n=1 Tax=Aphanomyces stellatus TaxID=120398 RepID=A0A485KNP9_9STRA|nr:hypothetical protein As57867_009607 [Aphanomyces stellatus]VFT86524.1 Aste57867_9645 [Aphanomyces stellatus]